MWLSAVKKKKRKRKREKEKEQKEKVVHYMNKVLEQVKQI
jgi:hypothetical protein